MSVLFEYPTVTPLYTVTLRNPRVGESDQTEYKTRFAIAADGSPYSYKYSPPARKLLLSFESIRQTQLDDFIALMEAALGNDIKITDWRGLVWQGILLNETFEFARNRDNCNIYSFSIEFDGVNNEFPNYLLTEDYQYILTESGENIILEGLD